MICLTSGLVFCLFVLIWFFLLFVLFTRYNSNLKTSSAPESHPYYMGLRFASVPCSLSASHCSQHACTDTPQDAAEWRDKSCTILSEKVLFLIFHTLCSPCVHQNTDNISRRWYLYLIMLQSSLIL